MVHPFDPYWQASFGLFFRIIAFPPVFKQPIRGARPLFLFLPARKALAATREKV
jgi:hypothetical protein